MSKPKQYMAVVLTICCMALFSAGSALAGEETTLVSGLDRETNINNSRDSETAKTEDGQYESLGEYLTQHFKG
mgnify:CR=1 FL=1